MSSVTIRPVVGDELYCKYPGQSLTQDCYLELDCDTGYLKCGYNSEIGSDAVPMDVHNRRAIRWDIPPLTASAANALMNKVAKSCQVILDGYKLVWDGNNHRGKLTRPAAAAKDEIESILFGHQWADADIVSGDCDD